VTGSSSSGVPEALCRYDQQTRLDPETTIIYACGNAGMIRTVQQQFSPRGFTIHTEKF